jgi:hypothetical protein
VQITAKVADSRAESDYIGCLGQAKYPRSEQFESKPRPYDKKNSVETGGVWSGLEHGVFSGAGAGGE